MLYLDSDHFKAGLRDSDLCARIGGDELMCLTIKVGRQAILRNLENAAHCQQNVETGSVLH